MATFTKFLDVLPNPVYKIGAAGQEDAGGDPGQGFSSVTFSYLDGPKQDRTIAGKLINRTNVYPKWLIGLNYNPMLKADFDPIYNFLMEKRGGLKPFYVSLPQYTTPRDSLFATFVQNSGTSITTGTEAAGVTSIEVTESGWSANDYTTSGLPTFGDLFTILDNNDTLHTKAYQVAFVETYNDYQTGNQPSTGNIRIHFTPGLQKATVSGSVIEFDAPLIKVVQIADVQEYDLDVDNLYSFSLKLEEAFY